MFDIWLGELELTRWTLLLAALLLLSAQLWLCFRVRSRLLRLLPVLALTGLTAGLLFAASTTAAWEGLGYALLAALAGLLLLACGVGWCAWWLITRRRAKR